MRDYRDVRSILGRVGQLRDDARLYPQYYDMAEYMRLSNFVMGGLPDYKRDVTIVGYALHSSNPVRLLLGVEQSGQQYIVGSSGVELIRE